VVALMQVAPLWDHRDQCAGGMASIKLQIIQRLEAVFGDDWITPQI
jgi:hypothetical protein